MVNILTGQADTGKEIHTDLLKVRGKTLIFGNTIYQIPNIAVVEVVDLVKPIPAWIIILFLLSIGIIVFGAFTSSDNFISFGGVVAVFSFMTMLYYRNNLTNTGLRIITNAGAIGSILIVSKDKEFMKQVALTLMNIMDSENENIVANFSIGDRQINISGTDGSIIAVDTTISGDIVNKIS